MTGGTAVRIGNRASWTFAGQERDDSGGLSEAVTDKQILEAYRIVARTEAVFVEPASAASIAGLLMTAAGCWLQADITLGTSSGDLLWPLALTGIGFAFLFVPLTTAAPSNIPPPPPPGSPCMNTLLPPTRRSTALSPGPGRGLG